MIDGVTKVIEIEEMMAAGKSKADVEAFLAAGAQAAPDAAPAPC